MLKIELDKTFQVADWRIRPLPKGMLDYARSDSHYLIPLFVLMQQMLVDAKDMQIPEELSEHSAENKVNDYISNLKEF